MSTLPPILDICSHGRRSIRGRYPFLECTPATRLLACPQPAPAAATKSVTITGTAVEAVNGCCLQFPADIHYPWFFHSPEQAALRIHVERRSSFCVNFPFMGMAARLQKAAAMDDAPHPSFFTVQLPVDVMHAAGILAWAQVMQSSSRRSLSYLLVVQTDGSHGSAQTIGLHVHEPAQQFKRVQEGCPYITGTVFHSCQGDDSCVCSHVKDRDPVSCVLFPFPFYFHGQRRLLLTTTLTWMGLWEPCENQPDQHNVQWYRSMYSFEAVGLLVKAMCDTGNRQAPSRFHSAASGRVNINALHEHCHECPDASVWIAKASPDALHEWGGGHLQDFQDYQFHESASQASSGHGIDHDIGYAQLVSNMQLWQRTYEQPVTIWVSSIREEQQTWTCVAEVKDSWALCSPSLLHAVGASPHESIHFVLCSLTDYKTFVQQLETCQHILGIRPWQLDHSPTLCNGCACVSSPHFHVIAPTTVETVQEVCVLMQSLCEGFMGLHTNNLLSTPITFQRPAAQPHPSHEEHMVSMRVNFHPVLWIILHAPRAPTALCAFLRNTASPIPHIAILFNDVEDPEQVTCQIPKGMYSDQLHTQPTNIYICPNAVLLPASIKIFSMRGLDTVYGYGAQHQWSHGKTHKAAYFMDCGLFESQQTAMMDAYMHAEQQRLHVSPLPGLPFGAQDEWYAFLRVRYIEPGSHICVGDSGWQSVFHLQEPHQFAPEFFSTKPVPLQADVLAADTHLHPNVQVQRTFTIPFTCHDPRQGSTSMMLPHPTSELIGPRDDVMFTRHTWQRFITKHVPELLDFASDSEVCVMSRCLHASTCAQTLMFVYVAASSDDLRDAVFQEMQHVHLNM